MKMHSVVGRRRRCRIFNLFFPVFYVAQNPLTGRNGQGGYFSYVIFKIRQILFIYFSSKNICIGLMQFKNTLQILKLKISFKNY